MEGPVVTNIWTDVPPINSQAQEAEGYPTQKPLALLERIISASSNPGDLVLDPFCWCGTAVVDGKVYFMDLEGKLQWAVCQVKGGNVWERNEAILYEYSDYVLRAMRGGSFYDGDYYHQASTRNYLINYSPLY